MTICLNLKKEEPKKITSTKELAQYIIESGNDVDKMRSEEHTSELQSR